ncbi:MAG: hypothetical protein M4579_001205 [Chaenotheca gracillima]|nr:MAG: hypothetical protein M4579_001205 [Chaenotheca gracillima]
MDGKTPIDKEMGAYEEQEANPASYPPQNATPKVMADIMPERERDAASPTTLGDPARTPRSEAPSTTLTPLSSGSRPSPSLEDVNRDYFASYAAMYSGSLHPLPSPISSSANSSASNSANVSTASIPELRSSPHQSSPSPSPALSTSSQDSSDMRRDLIRARAARSAGAPDPPSVPAAFTSSFHPTQNVDSSTAQGERDYPIYPNQAHSALHAQAYPPPHVPPPVRTRSFHPHQHSSYSASATARRMSRDLSHVEPGSRTVGSTPVSSPGLFGPAGPPPASAPPVDAGHYNSPYLHWTQKQRPKETHVADVDIDPISGRKVLNQYEIIDELGRGVHGKVKLGRSLERNVDVAIKIVDRYSKRRRLGKLGNPEDKTKKEVAILKKAIHPNVVSLLEVIDDPAKKKVYIVLEFVELGEIMWRVKGVDEIVAVEKHRIERESKGLVASAKETADDAHLMEEAERRRRKIERTHHNVTSPTTEYWSLEYGDDSETDTEMQGNGNSRLERWTSEVANASTNSNQITAVRDDDPALPLSGEQSRSSKRSSLASEALISALDGSMYGAYVPDANRGRAAGSAESMKARPSHAASEDSMLEDFAYVPCLTISQARKTFRDTVLGLEYLHYQGIIHRDIKPANLLWNADHRVKISDFGVSYLGRPIRDDDHGEELSEADAQPLDEAVELAKTVGTPAFYAPELCYTDLSLPRPPVTGQIDIWALGVTLYCLLFARVPFLADDQFSLYKSIASDEVFIPRRRLKAVDPRSSHRTSSRPRSRPRTDDHRLSTELAYEDIDDDLYDLLKRILEKDPTKRITLKEVKRHPFVLHGIPDPIKWIDETDPSRQNEGRKIEVSNEDVEQAVVPLGFLDRVRSSMRKVGAAIGFGKGREGRRRAQSTATSTDGGGGSSSKSTSPAATLRDERRPSLRGDESIFNALKSSREGDHPLSQSVTASPEFRDDNPFFTGDTRQAFSAATTPLKFHPSAGQGSLSRNVPLDRTVSTSGGSVRTIRPCRTSESGRSSPPLPSPGLPDQPTAVDPATSTNLGGIFGGAGRRLLRSMRSRDLRSGPDKGAAGGRRTSSVDRVALGLDDSHAEPSVAFSSTYASGRVDQPPTLRENPAGKARSEKGPSSDTHRLAPPPLRRYAGSTGEISREPSPVAFDEHEENAPNTENVDSLAKSQESLRPRPYESTTESFARAQAELYRRRKLEVAQEHDRPTSAVSARQDDVVLGRSNCPPSPDDVSFYQERVARSATRPLSAHIPITNVPTTQEVIASSSSEDHLNSGMSQSFSYPSVPSVVSARSSISADESGVGPPKPTQVLPLSLPPATVPEIELDADSGYNGDHAEEDDADDDQGNEDSDDDEDDFLVMTRRKTRSQGVGRSESVSNAQLARHRERHETSGTMRKKRSGSSGTLKKVLSNDEAGRRRSLDAHEG